MTNVAQGADQGFYWRDQPLKGATVDRDWCSPGRSTAVSAFNENWRLVAACRTADPDLFFPVSSHGRALDDVTRAKAICAQCGVHHECLAFAVVTHQRHGVWGGMTEDERYRLGRTGSAVS
jgi:WhiB family transcriptional regulator, redox-sensing transcriptional regulator